MRKRASPLTQKAENVLHDLPEYHSLLIYTGKHIRNEFASTLVEGNTSMSRYSFP